MLGLIGDMRTYLAARPDAVRVERLRVAETIGRPAAEADFLRRLEQETGRRLLPLPPGPKRQRPVDWQCKTATVTGSLDFAQ
jgi:hypothetical protein